MSEPLDRNKSALTHVATATVAAWLDGLGCKPIETEVVVGSGWTLDVASFWCPTLTEARRSRLIRDLVPDAAARDSRESFQKMSCRIADRLTIGVEVKVSREDYLRDRGRKYGIWENRAKLDPPAHLCVIATTGDLLKGDRLEGWAWLRLSPTGERVVKFEGQWSAHPLHPYQVEDFIASIAIRRDHHTRYASLRRWQKHYRANGVPDRRQGPKL